MIFSSTGRIVLCRLKINGGFLISFVSIVSLFTWCPSLLFAQDMFSISCITESIHEVTVSSLDSGRISAIHFKEGDLVEKGQIILEQDKKLEDLEVRRRKLIWESKAEVNSASERVDTLKSLLGSTRALFESTQSVSREELVKAELEYKVALAEHMRLEIAEERERIEYEMALENLRKKILKSPIRGTITRLYLEKGESCNQLEALVDIVDISRCILVCNVEEGIGLTLKKGESVDLEIKTGSGSINKKGRIIFISPVVDPASNLMEVKTEFNNRDGTIRPGVSGVMLLKAPDR